MKKALSFLSLIVAAMCFCGCEKYLDIRSSKSTVIPSSLDDLQALLDATPHINLGFYPALLEIATDDYFVPHNIYNLVTAFEQESYIWKPEPLYLQQDVNGEWTNPFRNVSIANTVLDRLPMIDGNTSTRGQHIKGTALFFRGFSYFLLAQVYCAPYNTQGNNSGLGLPLRLTPDFNEPSVRSSVQGTYDQIISDLNSAADLLPVTVEFPTRPNKAAAYAALARAYLAMEVYDQADEYAAKALNLYDELIDFNELDLGAALTFAPFHRETIFYAASNGYTVLNPRYACVDTELYESYDELDLRKKAFFTDNGNDTYSFKGSYMGNTGNGFFVGLAVDELFLIRAECQARAGRTPEAMEHLNHLLRHRWVAEHFAPLQVSGSEECLRLILEERRKELLSRGVRWSDLRRLNKDPRFAKTLIRVIDDGSNQTTYTLPPNDPRYVFLIPQEVIRITGMQQNLR
ncbi:RagB/SusD family nutrient uptake outer membrane protein [Parapedobacter deserti]|uniref:RagB/SusD family nutrient uptake outer membrane protein n=1 Tax=Parapedobacter deserti TaxID=1912957 RepID=A0ABV7JJG3_9SPHI